MPDTLSALLGRTTWPIWTPASLSIIPLIFVFNKVIDTIGNVGLIVSTIQIIYLIGSITPTGIALKRLFDQNGRRKVLQAT